MFSMNITALFEKRMNYFRHMNILDYTGKLSTPYEFWGAEEHYILTKV